MRNRVADPKVETQSTLSRQPAEQQQVRVGHPLHQLQRQYGNRYVQHLLAQSKAGEEGASTSLDTGRGIQQTHSGGVQARLEPAIDQGPGLQRQGEEEEEEDARRSQVQTKLTLGSPGDVYEQEANRVAEQVSTFYKSNGLGGVSRSLLASVDVAKVFGLADIRRSALSRTAGGARGVRVFANTGTQSAESQTVDPAIERRILQSRGNGVPLPATVRNTVALQTGYDFGNVRVKTDAEAASLNKSLGARAFTLGSSIWLGENESINDVKLMAHELTHVVQQGAARRIGPQGIAGFYGMKSTSNIRAYLQALMNGGGHDPSIYAQEIAQFQRENTSDQIASLQRQILEKPKDVDIQQKSDSQILRRCGGGSGSNPSAGAVPTNFRQTAGRDAGGSLHFEYAWDSSTGRLADLSDVEVGEHVSYPGGFTDPPFRPRPNPTIIWLAGTAGGFQDNHTRLTRRPYKNATLNATQVYRYRRNRGSPVNLMGPIGIARQVIRKPNGDYKWTVSKSGQSAEVDPLP